MTTARFILGASALAIATLCVSAGAAAVQRRLLPEQTLPTALLARVIIGLSTAVVVAQLLGVVGWFKPVPTLLGLATAGAVQRSAARRTRGPRRSSVAASHPPEITGRAGIVTAVFATAVVVGDWVPRTASAAGRGVLGYDSLWYHLPTAARFVQEASVVHLHYHDPDPITVFVPMNSELLHALGIVALGSDVLSPFLNLGWLAVALLAAWCIGRPFGLGAVTLTGACAALATNGLLISQAGQAYSDISAVALVAASVAFVVAGLPRPQPPAVGLLSVAALASGLALGTKFTTVAPIAVLTVAVVGLSAPGTRRRTAVVWVGLASVTGGLWYVRNWVVAANPVPWIHLELGPLEFRSPRVRPQTNTVAEYLFDGQAWNDHIRPAFDGYFGAAWWAFLAVTVAGLLAAIAVPRVPTIRVMGVMGLITMLAYLIAPQVLEYGTPGVPLLFSSNIRYSLLAVLTAFVSLPLTRVVTSRAHALAILVVFIAMLASCQLHKLWSPSEDALQPTDWLDILAGLTTLLIVAGAGYALTRETFRRALLRSSQRGIVAGVVVLLVAGLLVHEVYIDGRYAGTKSTSAIDRWALEQHDQRIAITGILHQYALYGDDLSNFVQYLGARGPYGSYERITDCREWKRALNAGDYSFVVMGPLEYPVPHPFGAPERTWAETDPAVRLIRRDGQTYLFQLRGRLDPDSCPPAA